MHKYTYLLYSIKMNVLHRKKLEFSQSQHFLFSKMILPFIVFSILLCQIFLFETFLTVLFLTFLLRLKVMRSFPCNAMEYLRGLNPMRNDRDMSAWGKHNVTRNNHHYSSFKSITFSKMKFEYAICKRSYKKRIRDAAETFSIYYSSYFLWGGFIFLSVGLRLSLSKMIMVYISKMSIHNG